MLCGNSAVALLPLPYISPIGELANIRTILQQLKPELAQRFHVRSLGIFGSVTRHDFTPESDIDIIVELSRPVGMEFIDLADFIERKLQKKVDLVSRAGIRERYFKAIEPEIVYV